MILENETKEKFKYEVCNLSNGSNHNVVVKCDYCNNIYETSMKRLNIGRKKLPKDCCYNCRKFKREDISLIKHGVKNPFQREEVKEKTKKTCLQKYGVEFVTQSENMKQKSKQTMLERYNVENASNSTELRQKQINSLFENYGVTNPTQSEEIQQRIRETSFKKYNNEYYVASEECRSRVKEKYGVDNVFQLDDVKQKIKQSRILSGNIKQYEGRSVDEWAKELGFSREWFNELVNKYGWEKAVKSTRSVTILEKIVKEILDNENINYEFQYRVENKIADFLVEQKLIIETDGDIFHSDWVQKDNNYHVNKKKLYTQYKFDSVFFRQEEIIDKTDIIKSVILNKLGRSQRIFARKLSIKEISNESAKKFFNKNHLMNYGQGKTIVLLDDHHVYAAMQLRRRQGNHWEVSRFCTKLENSVIGGYSKLLKYFEKTHKPESLITFVDLRYGSGTYLSDFGFKLESCYKSFKWTNGQKSFHRMKFPSNSGYDFGFYKIWDCGQAKWRKVYN